MQCLFPYEGGRLYACARREGYNILAMGQHLDDLAERFLCRDGQVSIFFCNFLFFLLHFINNMSVSCLMLNNILHTMNYYNTLLTKNSHAIHNYNKLNNIIQ